MTWYRLEPLDVWRFRDVRPFRAGEDHRARTAFPPLATVLQGALRARIVAEGAIDPLRFRDGSAPECADYGSGRTDQFGRFRLRGPFPLFGLDKAHFPLPLDIVLPRKGKDGPACLLTPRPVSGARFDSGYPYGDRLLWVGGDEPREPSDGFLELDQLERYLRGKIPEVVPLKEVWKAEIRCGHQWDPATRRPAAGLLYAAEFVRARPDWGLLVQAGLENPNEPLAPIPYLGEGGAVALGGEMRAAALKPLTPPPKWTELTDPEQSLAQGLKQRVRQCRRFKLVFLAPAIYRNGWPPLPLPPGKLVGAAVGRAVTVGGWQLGRGGRSLMRAIPAGSTLYFEEVDPATVDDLFRDYWWKCQSNVYADIGFGLTMVGLWSGDGEEETEDV